MSRDYFLERTIVTEEQYRASRRLGRSVLVLPKGNRLSKFATVRADRQAFCFVRLDAFIFKCLYS